MRTIAVVLVTLLGCKDSPTVAPPPNNPPPPADAAVAAKPPKPPAPEPIELPKLSGKPPAKTHAKHTQAQLETLSKLEWPDFKRDVRKLDTNFLTVKQATKSRPKIGVTTTITPCSKLVKCIPLTADKWRAEKDALMVTLAPELRNRPDTTFEIGESTLGGEKVIYVYQLGQFIGKDENGNMNGAYSNAYILYHHDGTNFIRVVTEYIDDPVGSKADLGKAVPREQLERIGSAFLDAYTQAWAN